MLYFTGGSRAAFAFPESCMNACFPADTPCRMKTGRNAPYFK